MKIRITTLLTTLVKTRFYLVLPILTGSTCRNRRHEVEPRTNERTPPVAQRRHSINRRLQSTEIQSTEIREGTYTLLTPKTNNL